MRPEYALEAGPLMAQFEDREKDARERQARYESASEALAAAHENGRATAYREARGVVIRSLAARLEGE
jgi:hypothetical protein